VHGVLDPPPPDLESASYIASSRNSALRPKRCHAHGRVQMCHFNGWCTVLLIVSTCCLPFALSGCSGIMAIGAATGALTASPNPVTFGAVSIGQTASSTVSLLNGSSAPVEITQLNLTGQSFSLVSPSDFPVTIAAGKTYSLNVQFNPALVGPATGQLTIASNSSTNSTAVISLSGTGTAAPAALSALSCSSGAMTGAGTDACTVTLTASAPSGGLIVNLSSSSSAVTVPSTVTVLAGAASAGFTASVSSVSTAQTVTLTASAGSMFTSFTLQLNAAILALSINATSVAFGDVLVNTPATQSVTITSTGTLPVTMNGATLTGAGFAVSGAEFPATLNPGQAATLNIEFDPTAAGTATGQLTIASNSSTNGTAIIALSGTGTAAPVVAVAVTPATASVTTGTTQQFAAAVTGTSNTAVTWTASGAGCSGATCGTISSTGLYTAPATVPSSPAITITATSQSDPTKSASANVTIVAPPGATYYLAPAAAGGNDSNSGLSPAAPWLTPHHSVNCGDVILAAPSTAYLQANFGWNSFGTVTCAAGNNVAWLKCATFDACKISVPSDAPPYAGGMDVAKSYWGIQGWEVDSNNGDEPCFQFGPGGSGVSVHHGIFANDIAIGCGEGGYSSGPNVAVGADYFVVIGSIAYNAAENSKSCYSGIDVYGPVASDSLPGTHDYFAGNFSYDNLNPDPCGGGTPTDGNGLILDTFSYASYTGQTVVANNITLFNGGRGLSVFAPGSTPAKIYFEHNTSYGNSSDPNQNNYYASEIEFNGANYVEAAWNLTATNSLDGGGTHPIYALGVINSAGPLVVYDNWAYGLNSQNTVINNSGSFAYGPNNTLGTSPAFANPVEPGAPNCSGYASVPACMATVIANFTPTNAAAKGYGYQIPSSTSVYDSLFPQWLCNVNLPAGLVSMGCQSTP